MTFKTQHARASNLIDVLKQCVGALDAMGVYMPTMIGKAYLSEGAGSAPRVVFVPEDGGGKIGPPRELGNAASVFHACRAHVRGREGNAGIVSDVERSREVYDLADVVIDLVQTAGTGRIEWGSYADGSPTDTDAFGAEIVLSFTYRRDVGHSVARWSLAAATDDDLGPEPQPPPGEPAGGIDVDPSTVPVNQGP